MQSVIIVILLVVLLTIWITSTRRKLVVMNENINNAVSQIGVQVSSRFDALVALLDLTKDYAGHEALSLVETVKMKRSLITAQSTPSEVQSQESVILEALNRIAGVAERYPDLKADVNYTKCMDAVDSYGKMVRTSRLIYNDSVTRLNRAIQMLPTSLIAGILGFHHREYLEEEESNAIARSS